MGDEQSRALQPDDGEGGPLRAFDAAPLQPQQLEPQLLRVEADAGLHVGHEQLDGDGD